jgi:ATP-dependent helicase/nuclease subunit A
VAGAVVDDADRADWIERRAGLLDPQRMPRVMSATAVARQALDARDDDSVDEDDDGAERPEGGAVPPRRRGRAGTAIGRAVHAALQVLDLVDPQDLELQVRRQCDLESIPEHEATVAALVRSALQAPAVRAAAEHRHHKELFVSVPLGERVIEGYVDLLVETPDGLVVVDYKTDTVAGPAAIEEKLATYELQGAAYAAALEEVTGISVVDCRFVFCSTRGPIERSVDDLPGAMKRVRQILDA